MDPHNAIALYYEPDAYVERLSAAGPAVEGAPAGLMGRQVAGRAFLDAYLNHGVWERLAAVARTRERADSLVELCTSHPSSRAKQRRLNIQTEAEFLADPSTQLVHFPCPPDVRLAWGRRASGRPFALCGVTHTLCSAAAVQALCDLVDAPFASFDALICTSRAVADMVRAVTGSWADYLQDRFGGAVTLRPRLEVIPLGVDAESYRPATSHERQAQRKKFDVAKDEVVVFCVGRLSNHAKAHPFPVFHAASQAAQRTGRKVHLIFAGWAAHPAVAEAFRSGARYFAPAARVSFIDGQDPTIRAGAWHAADIFVSLPDNIQETFGLVVIEAMASGLPVIGSDWDGYRDLVVESETGYLIPTRLVHGATSSATTRLLLGHLNYDHFLAECSQSVVVDAGAAAAALTKLVADADMCRRMGTAGRQRSRQCFTWKRVIAAYESLWREQQSALRECGAAAAAPTRFPPLECSFAGYPSQWLTDAFIVQTVDGAAATLAAHLTMPLTNSAADRRCSDATLLAALLRLANEPHSVGALADFLERAGTAPEQARATVAWLLKYEFLRVQQS